MNSAVRKALQHPNILGAGAAKRRKLRNREDKKDSVMAEYHRGTLHSGSGDIVKDPKQAWAIAESEARRRALRHIMRRNRGT